MIVRNVTVNLDHKVLPVRVRVSQFDSLWQFVFTVQYGGAEWTIPGGATVAMQGLKPDGNVFAFGGTVANNKVTVNCDVQMTAVAGEVVCELVFLQSGKNVGTANFILECEAAPKSPEDISSESTLPVYGELINDFKGDKGDTGNGISSVVKSGSSGAVDTYTINFTDGNSTTFEVTNGSFSVSVEGRKLKIT